LAPLHVCLLTKEFAGFGASGGIGTLYYHLASELLLMGHAVTVIAPSDSADHKAEYVQGRFRVRYVKRQGSVRHGGAAAGASVNNLNWSISALAAVAALHQEHAVDVVDSALWDTEALALSYVKRDNRPPLVLRLVTPLPIAARINEWSMPPNELRLLCAAEHALIENADAVVPISDAVADSIEEEHKVSRDARWKKCYCGVAYWPFFDSQLDYTSLSEVNGKPFPVPREARVVLFVGRLERRKGVDVLIAAANKFLASAPDAHLVLAGRDVEGWTNLSRKILDRGVQSRVHFLQEVTDEIREKLLHAAHCVVFSSRYESFGLVPLEAFVHGVPVVAANTGAIPEVVADGQAGLLYETENAAQLAEKVTALLDDASLRERLSAGARRAAREFSSRKSAIRTVEIYRELVHARASKGD
jgi:glycosyltransferase involved in cell wall biosynthesis